MKKDLGVVPAVYPMPVLMVAAYDANEKVNVMNVAWNGNAAKLDIREWHPNHERCGKGITLTEDEGRNLYAALKAIYEKE